MDNAESGNEVQKPKRNKYTKRQGEFNDMTLEQVMAVRDQVACDLKALSEALKTNPNDVELVEQRKELVNKRVRVYSRMRDLGYSAAAHRAKKAPETPTPATDPAPITQQPQ